MLTAASLLLAAGSLLPAGVRLLMFAILVIVAGSSSLYLVFWIGEQLASRSGPPCPLAIGSMILTSVSTMVVILVLLHLPGGRGSVQLWAGHAAAMFVFYVRVAVTIFVLPITPLICGLIGKIRLELGAPFRLGWLIAAITSYILAWSIVWSQAFFPLV